MDDLKNHISKLREDFTKGTLSEADVTTDPFFQFTLWLQQAVDAKIPEVQAANLATVSSEGKPSSRIVYLREFEKNNLSFYTNYKSKKAKDLEQNPNVCLTFFWPELERQVRIEGMVEKASTTQSDAYFDARPYDSKVGAWSSEQSQPLFSRGELELKIEEIKKLYSPENIKRPDFWGGYVLKAESYEFWQGRKSRLHDRILYTLQNNNWLISRLAP